MSVCAIATCKNTHKNSKGKNVIFHVFPKGNNELCKEWLQKCHRNDPVNVKNARICSEHFMEEDYEDDMKNRLLGLPIRKFLKPFATPRINIPGACNLQINSDRHERQKKREIIVSALDTLKSLSPKKGSANQSEENITVCNNCSLLDANVKFLKQKYEALEKNLQKSNAEKVKLKNIYIFKE